MKLIATGCTIALLCLMMPVSSPAEAELEEHLRFLEPLLGREWVGGYVGEDAPDLEIVLRFEPILDGRAVRYVREAAEVDFRMLMQIYRHPERAEVRFLSLTNRGIVGEGVARLENGKIILRGQSHRPDATTEFKTLLEIDPQGTLIDTFLRLEDGEWVEGHVQEYIAGGT